MNASKDGILKFWTAILVAYNVDTKNEYSRPNFNRMDITNFSYFLLIPHLLSKITSDLNLVMNSSIVSNSLGINEINLFSNWCPIRSSCFSKRDSSLIHTSLGPVKLSIWKISYGERERDKESHKLHPSCYAT